jgi:polyisoprenoid-binding protein YceI
MNARTLITALIGAVIGGAVGVFGFIYFVGGDGTPSEAISAPTLDVNAIPTLNPTQAFAAVTQVAELNAQITDMQATIVALNASVAAAQDIQATAISAEVATEEPVVIEVTEETAVVAAGRTLYRIDSANSQASFTLQEDLRGSRIDVVGTTNEVAGDIILDFANPAASQIGTIRINARALETDQDMRNRAIRSRILQSSSDEYEFIEFVPTAITGLPDSINVGETHTFEITGNLTLVGQTREVTFTAEATLASESQLNGTAITTIDYTQWGIAIPSAPGVANVTPEVTLSIDFAALQTES